MHAYIFFCNYKHAFSFILRKYWVHAFVLLQDKHNWILVHPRCAQLDIKVMPYSVDTDVPAKYRLIAHTCVRIEITESVEEVTRLNMNCTCIGTIKYLLGLKKACIITPYQLYKYLLKSGGKTWELVKK